MNSEDPRRFEEFWSILDLVEDYVHCEPISHPPPPDFERLGAAANSATHSAAGGRGEDPSDAGLWGDWMDVPPDAGIAARRAALASLEKAVQACTRCALAEKRTQAVPGVGVLDPELMIVGEGPGGEEDRQGEPFVGRAGQYLDKWLEAIELSRHKNVYITNVVKCRPPANRDPYPQESHACRPYLDAQIRIVRPKAIMTVGRIATTMLLDTPERISKLRGVVTSYRGVPLMPTYHPSAVLRNDNLRRPVWEDLKTIRKVLDGVRRAGI